MYNAQMYVLDSIFGRICHPFLKYEQNTYTYEQHGSLMELEYRILCMYARALTEASTESSMMAFHFCFGISRNERAVWRCTVSVSPWISITHGRISMVQPPRMYWYKADLIGPYFRFLRRHASLAMLVSQWKSVQGSSTVFAQQGSLFHRLGWSITYSTQFKTLLVRNKTA